jgi:hypothetical protein
MVLTDHGVDLPFNAYSSVKGRCLPLNQNAPFGAEEI